MEGTETKPRALVSTHGCVGSPTATVDMRRKHTGPA